MPVVNSETCSTCGSTDNLVTDTRPSALGRRRRRRCRACDGGAWTTIEIRGELIIRLTRTRRLLTELVSASADLRKVFPDLSDLPDLSDFGEYDEEC